MAQVGHGDLIGQENVSLGVFVIIDRHQVFLEKKANLTPLLLKFNCIQENVPHNKF